MQKAQVDVISGVKTEEDVRKAVEQVRNPEFLFLGILLTNLNYHNRDL